jgi:hypothetical protein
MRGVMRVAAALLCSLLATSAAEAAAPPPALSFITGSDGSFNVSVGGSAWYVSAPPSLCLGGVYTQLQFIASAPASGADAFGAWTGAALSYSASGSAPAQLVGTLKTYAAAPGVAVASASFPSALAVSGCGGNDALASGWPSFDLSKGAAQAMGALSWSGTAVGSTLTAAGLAALSPKGLDSGPVITYARAALGVASPALAWSTLDSHKIVTQRVATPPPPPTPSAPFNLSALYSAQRADQLVCASALCLADQQPEGGYVLQRVEGVALALSPADAARGKACVNGALVDVAPLVFAWSSSRADNWAGAVVPGPFQHALPDGSYSIMGDNGAVVAQAGVAGTAPLVAYTKSFAAGNRTDWAAVSSPEGLAWAEAQGYAPQYTIGYVFSAPPVMCAQQQQQPQTQGAVYEQGLVAAVPAIPAGWQYSIVYTTAAGGPTAATYALGAALQQFHNTTRSPSVTLTDVGLYTDDGAYYYVWEAFNIPARPWPAEVGMRLVKEKLYEQGVPVAYMQLDDWWCASLLTRSLPPNLRLFANSPHPPSNVLLSSPGTLASSILAMSRASPLGTRATPRASSRAGCPPLPMRWACNISCTSLSSATISSRRTT